MAKDPELRAHQEWIGYLQPVGLVVSPSALMSAQVFANRDIVTVQETLQRLVGWPEADQPSIKDFPAFSRDILRWEPADLAGAKGGPPLPNDLEAALPEYEEVLAPDFAVPLEGQQGQWLLLVQILPGGIDMDRPGEAREGGWHAGPEARFERLLRETKVPIGLLVNGTLLRLVYAPVGESSGHVTFPVRAMCEVAGRPILSALHMLLNAERLFTVKPAQRLPAILQASRKYQNEVSTALAEQVHSALNELLGGLQAADNATGRRLLQDVLREAPDEVYGGLLTTLMRLVFILYAEDRGLFPTAQTYIQHYSVTGLFERLREDAARCPDTMDQRYGAWARLLSLFRLIHDGGGHGDLHLPPRYGRLFDPDVYPFLEGRPNRSRRSIIERLDPPRIPDGAIYRALENLLMLDGERISYRALDVEQIGSVYEAMMGFSLQVAKGPSIALRPDHVVVDLREILSERPEDRAKYLKKAAGCEVQGPVLDRLKAAKTVEEAVEGLGNRVSPRTPRPLPMEALYLQPTEERRRSGSHYTPRSLTEPIVRTTLRPVLEALGPNPTPEQILDLKVCDPAMGSGAFLVEACRLLADRLVAAWQIHKSLPSIPPDQDPYLCARRIVAQMCLYGVDKNPFAVDLAKLSLWLATLAKEHPFTFLDHALRCGDSLVGLTTEQIAHFHWEKQTQIPIIRELIDRKVQEADMHRARIREMAASDDTREKRRLLSEAEDALADVRLIGDLVIVSFFGAEKAKAREALRRQHAQEVQDWLARKDGKGGIREAAIALREGQRPIPPFHWEIEFPEVFGRGVPGFDAIVGNPPFMGGSKVSNALSKQYAGHLASHYPESRGKSDLVSYFFRRSFDLCRECGCFGLLATKTIRQGDTRFTSLRWIRTHGGHIYSATRRLKWPGAAAVTVSVLHVRKGDSSLPCFIDGRSVPCITAYLLSFGPDENASSLVENRGIALSGINPNGEGFVLSATERKELIAEDSRCAGRIHPYLGSEDMNEEPSAAANRFIISLEDCDEETARSYMPLYRHLYETVRVQRQSNKEKKLRDRWWCYSRPADELHNGMKGMGRVLVNGRHATFHTMTMQPSSVVFSDAVTVFLLDDFASFALLQARVHELWSALQGSSLEDRLRYIPEDCFDTFPLPRNWRERTALEDAGKHYYEVRAAMMLQKNEGLTALYSRFHDPDDTDASTLRLRKLHDAMDRAVLDAYQWTHIHPTCEFLLDYEVEEDADNPSKKRKPWRYRWPDDIRDEVLARLLALNKERAEAEATGSSVDSDSPSKPRPNPSARKRADAPGQRLIE